MGKKKFNKKETVRFVLVAGVDENGKPDNKFKPIETYPNAPNSTQRQQIIEEMSEFEHIEINGRKFNESEIPSYILEQIKGRTDLIYNQKH